jgi:Uncharacterized conserved protein CG6151-P
MLRAGHCKYLQLRPSATHHFLSNMPVCIRSNQPKVSTGSSVYSASSLVILFIEVPFLLRICPTSEKFDTFIRRFSTNYMRAAVYLVMSIVQWLSLIIHASSLIVAAVVLLITASFYGIAAARKDEFMSSKTLGGQGVAQMIV